MNRTNLLRFSSVRSLKQFNWILKLISKIKQLNNHTIILRAAYLLIIIQQFIQYLFNFYDLFHNIGQYFCGRHFTYILRNLYYCISEKNKL